MCFGTASTKASTGWPFQLVRRQRGTQNAVITSALKNPPTEMITVVLKRDAIRERRCRLGRPAHPGRVVQRQPAQHNDSKTYLGADRRRPGTLSPPPERATRGGFPRHEALRGDQQVRPFPAKPDQTKPVASGFG